MTSELSPCNNHAGGSASCSCHDCREQTFIPGESRTITVKRTSTSTHTCEVTSKQSYGLDLSTLIAPQVLEANSRHELELRSFPGDAQVFVEKGGLIRAGETAWLLVTGIGNNGVLVTHKLMDGDLITADDEKSGLTRFIPREKLLDFSHKTVLTVTLKVSTCHNSCDNELVVYPELVLTLLKPYRDLTTFDDQTLGKWAAGAGASDPRDLNYVPHGTGFILQNVTFSDGIGAIVWRLFHDLEIGRKYRFSVCVKRANAGDPAPRISLRMNDVDHTNPVQLTDILSWKILSFDFVPTSLPVKLEVYNYQGGGAQGNDTQLDNLLVEDI